MAHSLEVRAPFLDHELVSWGMALPPNLKLRGHEGKHVLRRAMEGVLPGEVLNRRKQGFAQPLTDLFRREAGRVRERLTGGLIADSGLFDLVSIGAMIDRHEQGRHDHAGPIWAVAGVRGLPCGHVGAVAGGARGGVTLDRQTYGLNIVLSHKRDSYVVTNGT